ncbi:MAG: allantoate amidohydrolase [Actinomycetota bacterium]|nr:allantoate amidohydrolase [Actinomycetota bacterium]
MSFDGLWSDLRDLGRDRRTGGYRRFAWTDVDLELREWFVSAARQRGLDVTVDRNGNQWAWWGDPDLSPGVVTGSHLDSVPDGGAYDGPLGVVSAFAALDVIRANGFAPARPLGIVNFCDEEGARFGVACAGSRLLTGALAPERALGLVDADGVTLVQAMTRAGHPTTLGRDAITLGRDEDALRRVSTFVELHVEQGRGLVDLDRSVAVAKAIWPHGRYRAELMGEANHAGTTRLQDRRDPTLAYARLVLAAREAASRNAGVATCGKVRFEPNGVNAIASLVTAWIDARAPLESSVRAVVGELADLVSAEAGILVEESWTDEIEFDLDLRERLAVAVGDPPALATGAGHDAGVLAAAGVPTGMIFVRNPTGVSHSPAEFAERDDCLAGVAALAAALADLLGDAA